MTKGVAFYFATPAAVTSLNRCETPELTVLPVDTDRSEVKNRSRAAHYVEGDPGVAQRVSKHPTRVIHLRHNSSNLNCSSLD